jgi:hypothetical protein
MNNEQPKIGSKPGPSPEAVQAKLTEKLENDRSLSLQEFWGMAKGAGARFMGLEETEDGDVIALKGTVGDRVITTEILCPTGHPFPTYARSVLESFRQSPRGGARVERTTAAEPIQVPPPEAVVSTEPVEGGGHGKSTTKRAAGTPTTFRDHTSMIKKQDGTPQHRHEAGKKPPGAAGMCIQCEVQPVMHSGSQFCGARCAQTWHQNVIAKRQGVNLPRMK